MSTTIKSEAVSGDLIKVRPKFRMSTIRPPAPETCVPSNHSNFDPNIELMMKIEKIRSANLELEKYEFMKRLSSKKCRKPEPSEFRMLTNFKKMYGPVDYKDPSIIRLYDNYKNANITMYVDWRREARKYIKLPRKTLQDLRSLVSENKKILDLMNPFENSMGVSCLDLQRTKEDEEQLKLKNASKKPKHFNPFFTDYQVLSWLSNQVKDGQRPELVVKICNELIACFPHGIEMKIFFENVKRIISRPINTQEVKSFMSDEKNCHVENGEDSFKLWVLYPAQKVPRMHPEFVRAHFAKIWHLAIVARIGWNGSLTAKDEEIGDSMTISKLEKNIKENFGTDIGEFRAWGFKDAASLFNAIRKCLFNQRLEITRGRIQPVVQLCFKKSLEDD